jgi:tetratricopeptide (TPR) repeat protein
MTSVVESIRADIRRLERATLEIFARIENAIREEPNNPELWVLRGDAIQLSDELTNPLSEVERSYRKATEIDPTFAEAYESLGYFWFAVMDDAVKAKPFFEQAIRLGAGVSAQNGLAEAVAEIEERSERGAV